MTKILSRIGELKFVKLWRLALVGIKNPLLVLPTYKATSKTMKICDNLFGDAHSLDNRTNAFRHSLWNILISQNAQKVVKDEQKAILWAKKITDLHEKLMPNNPVEREMNCIIIRWEENFILKSNLLQKQKYSAF